MASKASLENGLRNEIIEVICEALEAHFDTDMIMVGTGEISFATVDAENNDKYPKIKISIPRGTRNGEGGYIPYDGYAAGQEYAEERAAKDLEKAARKAAKKAKNEDENEREE